ncbi:type IV secretion protein Rhs, partial [Pseudomonas chlororaphis]
MDRVAFIDEELKNFDNSLKTYRKLVETKAAQTLDQLPQFFDWPAIFGMNRVVKLGSTSTKVSMNDTGFSSAVAECPRNGKLLIESKFVSVYDIPVGNITVEIVPVKGGTAVPLTLDDQGKGVYAGKPGEKYYVRVQSKVTQEQVTELFTSYDTLTFDLKAWLEDEWKKYRPLWPNQTVPTIYMAQLEGFFNGSWNAIKGAFDGIKRIFEILKAPGEFADEIGQDAADLIKLAKETPAAMEKLMLLASDQAALFLLIKTAAIWLIELPPTLITGQVAEQLSSVVVTILIDLILVIILTFAAEGAGIPYLMARLAKYGTKIVETAVSFVKAIVKLLKIFMEKIEVYKKLATRSAVGTFERGKVRINWDRQNHAKVKETPHLDDQPRQSTSHDDKKVASSSETRVRGCPVSMVTGEELLTLTDGQLDGLMPFAWTRLYRTSAAEVDCGLGYGWSHALAQRLEISGDDIIWTDHENRITSFPMPNQQRPAITNSLSKAAIFLGRDPSELILTQAGEHPRLYHFRYN